MNAVRHALSDGPPLLSLTTSFSYSFSMERELLHESRVDTGTRSHLLQKGRPRPCLLQHQQCLQDPLWSISSSSPSLALADCAAMEPASWTFLHLAKNFHPSQLLCLLCLCPGHSLFKYSCIILQDFLRFLFK